VKQDSSLELDFESYRLKNNHICIIAPWQVFNMKLRGERDMYLLVNGKYLKKHAILKPS